MERNKVYMIALLLLSMGTTLPAGFPIGASTTQLALGGFWQSIKEKARELRTGIPASTPASPAPTPSIPTPTPASAPSAPVVPPTPTSFTTKCVVGGVVAGIAGRQVYNHFCNQKIISDITHNPAAIKYIEIKISSGNHEYVRNFYPQTNGTFTTRTNINDIPFAAIGNYLGNQLHPHDILKDTGNTETFTVKVEVAIGMNKGWMADRCLKTFTATLPHQQGQPTFGQALWNHYLAPRIRVLPYTQAECNALNDETKELVKIESTIQHHQIFTSPSKLSIFLPAALALSGVENSYVLKGSCLVFPLWHYFNKHNPVFEATPPFGLVSGGRTEITANSREEFNRQKTTFKALAEACPKQKYTEVKTYYFKDTTSKEVMSYTCELKEYEIGYELTTQPPRDAVRAIALHAAEDAEERGSYVLQRARAIAGFTTELVRTRAVEPLIASLPERPVLPALPGIPEWMRPDQVRDRVFAFLPAPTETPHGAAITVADNEFLEN